MRKTQNQLLQTCDPFQNLFHHLFREPTDGLYGASTNASANANPHTGNAAPRTNIAETDAAYELAFELPGVAEKDIQVELKDKTLTIKAERSSETDSKNPDGDSAKDTNADGDKDDATTSKRWHRVEHRYGRLSRAISLPTDAANDGVEAIYRAGVLTVTVPKQAEAQPARIAVRSA